MADAPESSMKNCDMVEFDGKALILSFQQQVSFIN